MKKIKKWMIILVSAIVICAVGGTLYFKVFKKEKVNTELLVSTLEKSSELTSAKLTYKGMYHYTDSGVPIWNKSDFYMVYTATARAGFNLSDAEVSVDDSSKTVNVVLPKASVQSVTIEDPEKDIEFHDVGFALFNFNSRDDENKAISEAENDARDKVEELGVLAYADNSAEEIVTGLLQNAIPKDYALKITTK